MNYLQTMLRSVKSQAEQCLASEAPSASQARELAASILRILGMLEATSRDHPHPYRFDSSTRADEQDELTATVALERSLNETRARLAAAERELANYKFNKLHLSTENLYTHWRCNQELELGPYPVATNFFRGD